MFNIQTQIRKGYTEDVERELLNENDVTNIKKKNYTMRR